MDPSPPSAVAPRALRDLPQPRGLPWIGHSHRLRPSRLHAQIERWAIELGTPYRLRFGPYDGIVFDDPVLAREVLHDRPGGWRRGESLQRVLAEMGIDGLFAAEGDAWLAQRRVIVQALNATHVTAWFPALRAITGHLLERCHEAAARGEVVDMTTLLKRYTVDVTSALAFGENPDTLRRDRDVIQEHLEFIFPAASRRALSPWPWWHRIRFPADRRLDRALGEVHAYVRGLIDRARERLERDPPSTPRHALEAVLMVRDEHGMPMPDARVVANVVTLLLAGEDTTAHSIAWTLPYVAADAVLQDRLHAQARVAFGDDALCPDVASLRTLGAFQDAVTEALRLRPVVPMLVVEPLTDTVVGGITAPRGTKVFLLMRPATLDPTRFSAPTRYAPERWSDAASVPSPGAHQPRAFQQFGAGPRVCPGRHLAEVEMRLVLSMLLRHFRVELACDPATIREVLAITLMPDRMPVRLHPR